MPPLPRRPTRTATPPRRAAHLRVCSAYGARAAHSAAMSAVPATNTRRSPRWLEGTCGTRPQATRGGQGQHADLVRCGDAGTPAPHWQPRQCRQSRNRRQQQHTQGFPAHTHGLEMYAPISPCVSPPHLRVNALQQPQVGRWVDLVRPCSAATPPTAAPGAATAAAAAASAATGTATLSGIL